MSEKNLEKINEKGFEKEPQAKAQAKAETKPLAGTDLKGCLKKALRRKEFQVYYQPIVDVASERVAGMEALLRWHRPGFGMVYPDDFIPITEETELIVPIGEWVLHTACLQAKIWRNAGYGPLKLAVNISPVQLQHKSFISTVERVLKETEFDPNCLELEITESVVFRNLDYVADTLRRLKKAGIIISMDDFGTGYSSLENINRLTVDSLKIDQTFIRDLDTNPCSKEIISATMTMANNLNLEVTAEGVEIHSQLHFLKQHKCHYFQGYLYSPPVPAEKFQEILEAEKTAKNSLKEQNGGRGV